MFRRSHAAPAHLHHALGFAAAWAVSACAPSTPPPEPSPQPAVTVDTILRVDTVRVESGASREAEARAAALQLQLLERDAQIEELQGQLDAAIREVVRSMARLQTLATRAEAASAMAEAEVAVQQLETRPGGRGAPEYGQAKRLLEMSSAEFNQQNYGGSLYLATQAKGSATTGRGRLAGSGADALQPGEVRFVVPVRLQVSGRSNVRDGPGTRFGVRFTMEPGTRVTGHSYVDQWVRVSDDQGRSGWIFYSLVTRAGG